MKSTAQIITVLGASLGAVPAKGKFTGLTSHTGSAGCGSCDASALLIHKPKSRSKILTCSYRMSGLLSADSGSLFVMFALIPCYATRLYHARPKILLHALVSYFRNIFVCTNLFQEQVRSYSETLLQSAVTHNRQTRIA